VQLVREHGLLLCGVSCLGLVNDNIYHQRTNDSPEYPTQILSDVGSSCHQLPQTKHWQFSLSMFFFVDFRFRIDKCVCSGVDVDVDAVNIDAVVVVNAGI
jgi:hypothetical protein